MKKSIIRFFAITLIMATGSTLMSFSPGWGGESFEIYVNDKLVIQQSGSSLNTVKTIKLDPSLQSSQIAVWYYHCGRLGKNRVVTLRDSNEKLLNEWRFDDATGIESKMYCSVEKVLAAISVSAGNAVSLHYSSSELPNGRKLAIFKMPVESKTAP